MFAPAAPAMSTAKLAEEKRQQEYAIRVSLSYSEDFLEHIRARATNMEGIQSGQLKSSRQENCIGALHKWHEALVGQLHA